MQWDACKLSVVLTEMASHCIISISKNIPSKLCKIAAMPHGYSSPRPLCMILFSKGSCLTDTMQHICTYMCIFEGGKCSRKVDLKNILQTTFQLGSKLLGIKFSWKIYPSLWIWHFRHIQKCPMEMGHSFSSSVGHTI